MGCAGPAEPEPKQNPRISWDIYNYIFPRESGTVELIYLGVSGKTGVYGGGQNVGKMEGELERQHPGGSKTAWLSLAAESPLQKEVTEARDDFFTALGL